MPSDKQDDPLVTYSIPVQDQQWFLSELAHIMYPAGSVSALQGNLATEDRRARDNMNDCKKMQARAELAEKRAEDYRYRLRVAQAGMDAVAVVLHDMGLLMDEQNLLLAGDPA